MLRNFFALLVFSVSVLCADVASPFSMTIRETLSVLPRSSPEKITTEQLGYWDKVAQTLTEKEQPGDALRMLVYLYSAQKAFADNSFIITGAYSGSLDPISEKTLQLFYPDFKSAKKITEDPFSLALTKELFKHVQDRFDAESKNIHPVSEKSGEQFWKGEAPYDGMNLPSMQPWMIKVENFGVAAPSEDKMFWQDQLQKVEKAHDQMTERQKERVLFWAGKTGVGSGDWCSIVNKYMEEHQVPLEKRLEVREKLACAMFDATVAVYTAKYQNWIKRPVMLDPQLKTVVPTPNHPSFPSAHSTIGAAVAVVLDYYLPENKQQWDQLAEEAGLSRIWGGIHFPIDHEAGKKLGQKVGETIIEN